MSHAISALMQFNVPTLVRGKLSFFFISITVNGKPEGAHAKLQATGIAGVTLHDISVPRIPYTFERNENLRSGQFEYLLNDVMSTWFNNAIVVLNTDQLSLSPGIHTVGNLTYYAANGERGVSIPLKVKCEAPQHPVPVHSNVLAKWKDVATGGWIYSYEVVLSLPSDSVESWSVSFNVVKGTTLFKAPWADYEFNESKGLITLVKPKQVAPNKPTRSLGIAIQLLYPAEVGNDPALETLKNLQASCVL